MENYILFEKEKKKISQELNNKDNYNDIIDLLNKKYEFYYENHLDNKYIKNLILNHLDYMFMAYVKI